VHDEPDSLKLERERDTERERCLKIMQKEEDSIIYTRVSFYICVSFFGEVFTSIQSLGSVKLIYLK